MRYRRFGKTEIQMPVISCGGMRYQHKWQDVDPADVLDGQANVEATIRRALELGINHIETARLYGSSEMQLGWLLPQLPRDEIIVQTKVAPAATADEFLTTFDTSMEYLGLDHVDLLSLHGIITTSFSIGRLKGAVAWKRRAISKMKADVSTSDSPPMPRQTSFSRRSTVADSIT